MSGHEDERRLRNERTVALNVPIPYPLRDRLDALIRELDLGGANPRLYELVATLILHAEEDRDKLVELYNAYRNATPEAAALKQAAGTVVQFRRRRPGRPPGR